MIWQRRLRCRLRGYHRLAILSVNDHGAMVVCAYCKLITYAPNWRQGMK